MELTARQHLVLRLRVSGETSICTVADAVLKRRTRISVGHLGVVGILIYIFVLNYLVGRVIPLHARCGPQGG